MLAADIADALTALPMRSFDDLAVKAPGLPRKEHGFYAWWQMPGALPGVRATPHPESAELELLYVGIAPEGPRSASHLRARLAKHHRGAIGGSTLRLSLAGFLWQREGWLPTYASRAQLNAAELLALKDWQRRHLSVQWVEVPGPWDTEPTVIALMRPPLNRSHNETHPEYERVGRARDSIRDEAKTRRVPFQKRA
jgi:hypothetical protein